MTIEELETKCAEAGIVLDETVQQKLETYTTMLVEWNGKMNLTAITDPLEINEKHYLDCLLPLRAVPENSLVCDVGSGAGFPGVVWAIARSDVHVVLLEPTGKRCTFLNALIKELGLTNASVVNERAEAYVKEKRESFDVVTARAVASLSILSELCVPLVKCGGIFLAMKGSKGKEEDQEAQGALNKLGCEKEEILIDTLSFGERVNLIYRKVRSTPAKYPRNYGQIKKKPL